MIYWPHLAGVAHIGTFLWDVDEVVRLAQVSESVGNCRLSRPRHLVQPVHHPPGPVRPHDVGLRDGDAVRNLPVRQFYYCVLPPSVDPDAVCQS